ncbi:MAG: hypothetical protein AAGA29_02905 [Planctomycetota bacterium]
MADKTDTTQAPKRSFAWLGALIPLVLIAAAAGSFFLFGGGAETPDAEPDDRAFVQVDKDYYVLVRMIELYPQRPGGEDWDRLGGSAPDIRYELEWQGNVVFEGKERKDTLIASWDALSLDLKSAILSGQVDLGSSVDAAIIHVTPDTEVVLNIWDADVGDKDEAGTITLRLGEMSPGDNELAFEASETQAVKRVVVRLIDHTLPVGELVEAATAP